MVYWDNTQMEEKTLTHAVTLVLACMETVVIIKIMELDDIFILS